MTELCAELHHHVHNKPRHRFPFDRAQIPQNGIYMLFERGEYGHGGDRIVRIGTHTGENQLRSRLNQHFINENKDRSIFRKNIGRALLAWAEDPFLEQWNWDLTSRANKEKYSPLLDRAKQQAVEARVTAYIQEAFSFVVFPVPDKADRLYLESRLIATVSLCDACRPSGNWLGQHSPDKRIRESGLWLVQHLYKEPMTGEDVADLF